MRDERRRSLRRPLLVECSWGRDARLTDLSYRGCYVDAERTPEVGTTARVEIPLFGEQVGLCGTVVHATPRVGFGIHFTAMDEKALNLVASYMLA